MVNFTTLKLKCELLPGGKKRKNRVRGGGVHSKKKYSNNDQESCILINEDKCKKRDKIYLSPLNMNDLEWKTCSCDAR